MVQVRRKHAGQALLEYVILLVIVVTIILGILVQYNKTLGQYFYSMFVGENSYLYCLIQHAVLPGAPSCEEARPSFDAQSLNAAAQRISFSISPAGVGGTSGGKA